VQASSWGEVGNLDWPTVLVSLATNIASSYVVHLLVRAEEAKARQQLVALLNPPAKPPTVDREGDRARMFLRKVSRDTFLSLTPRQQRALLRAAPGELLKRYPGDAELQRIIDAAWGEIAATSVQPRASYLGVALAVGFTCGLIILITLGYWPSLAPSAFLSVALITWLGGRYAARASIRRALDFPRGRVRRSSEPKT